MEHTHQLTKNRKTARHVVKQGDIQWVLVEKPDAKLFTQLEEDFKIHPVHLKESTQKIQLTEVEREADYMFLLVHLPTYDAASNRILTSQVGIFTGKDFVITVHDGQLSAITDLFLACSQDAKIAQATFKTSSGFLLYSILKQLLDDVSQTTERILNELDEVEALVFDDNQSDAYQIGKLRQKIIRLKRVIVPLQSVLLDLRQQIHGLSGEHLSKYYANNAKLANKLAAVIGEAQETIEIYKDADFTTSTEQTNQILTVLTLVFTFTIPLTVLGSLYGTNIPLPGGLETGEWTFLGAYTTFWVLLIVSILAAVSLFAYLRHKKWL